MSVQKMNCHLLFRMKGCESWEFYYMDRKPKDHRSCMLSMLTSQFRLAADWIILTEPSKFDDRAEDMTYKNVEGDR